MVMPRRGKPDDPQRQASMRVVNFASDMLSAAAALSHNARVFVLALPQVQQKPIKRIDRMTHCVAYYYFIEIISEQLDKEFTRICRKMGQQQFYDDLFLVKLRLQRGQDPWPQEEPPPPPPPANNGAASMTEDGSSTDEEAGEEAKEDDDGKARGKRMRLSAPQHRSPRAPEERLMPPDRVRAAISDLHGGLLVAPRRSRAPPWYFQASLLMSRDARSKQTIAKGLASKVNDYCDPRFYMASDEDGDSAKATLHVTKGQVNMTEDPSAEPVMMHKETLFIPNEWVKLGALWCVGARQFFSDGGFASTCLPNNTADSCESVHSAMASCVSMPSALPTGAGAILREMSLPDFGEDDDSDDGDFDDGDENSLLMADSLAAPTGGGSSKIHARRMAQDEINGMFRSHVEALVARVKEADGDMLDEGSVKATKERTLNEKIKAEINCGCGAYPPVFAEMAKEMAEISTSDQFMRMISYSSDELLDLPPGLSRVMTRLNYTLEKMRMATAHIEALTIFFAALTHTGLLERISVMFQVCLHGSPCYALIPPNPSYLVQSPPPHRHNRARMPPARPLCLLRSSRCSLRRCKRRPPACLTRASTRPAKRAP